MFDPYHRWLSIPKSQRPPTHYQLLGVAPEETDAQVINEAALRQTSHVRTYQTGPYAEVCTRILNEIALARATLLHREKRREYDARHATHRTPPPLPVPVVEVELVTLPKPPRPRKDRRAVLMLLLGAAGTLVIQTIVYVILRLAGVIRPRSEEPE